MPRRCFGKGPARECHAEPGHGGSAERLHGPSREQRPQAGRDGRQGGPESEHADPDQEQAASAEPVGEAPVERDGNAVGQQEPAQDPRTGHRRRCRGRPRSRAAPPPRGAVDDAEEQGGAHHPEDRGVTALIGFGRGIDGFGHGHAASGSGNSAAGGSSFVCLAASHGETHELPQPWGTLLGRCSVMMSTNPLMS